MRAALVLLALALAGCDAQQSEPPVDNAVAVDCAVSSAENNSAAVCEDAETIREEVENVADANAS